MSNETSSATIDGPAGGGARTTVEDTESEMSGAEACAVAISCSADLADEPVCQDPPDGPVPTVRGPSPDLPLQQTIVDNMIIDVAAGGLTGWFGVAKGMGTAFWDSTPTMLKSVVGPVALRTTIETYFGFVPGQGIERTAKEIEWALSSPKAVPKDPNQNGHTEIGVADPGENGGTTGVFARNPGPGPDGPADPGEGTGSSGVYVRPVGAGPDGPADPGENSGGGGGYVRPIGVGASDGPADPGEGGGGGGGGAGGGGGGGGGELHVGGGHGDAGPVDAE